MKPKRYYRKITDILPKRIRKVSKEEKKHIISASKVVLNYLTEYLFVCLMVLLLVVLYVLVVLQSIYEDKVADYDRKEQQYAYWVQTADQYPYAPDVLYNAALAALEVNDRERALFYIDRALQVDPLFSKADEMRKKLIE